MRAAEISSLNQINFVSQYVDPEVEHRVREFHQYCFSCAGSALDFRVSTPHLTSETLKLAESTDSRFSHLSELLKERYPLGARPATSRWPSLQKGTGAHLEFQKVAATLSDALAADGDGRRPYPSGGALYSAEAIVIAGNLVDGIHPFSVAHYLPVSDRFELLPGQFDEEKFESISGIPSVHFYVGYFISIKKALFKYRSRGYRLALLEVGSMYQQVASSAQNHGIASRVLAGFSEYQFARDCGVDSRLLLPVVIQAFGSQGDGDDR